MLQVSPRYLAGRTPEHIKKKVIELLYVWSKEQNAESKVVEAYNMLKKQGIVKEDPGIICHSTFALFGFLARSHETRNLSFY